MNKKKNENIRLSKRLTYFLRHSALEFGLDMDEKGFVNIENLLNIDQFKKNTLNQIIDVVKNNDKQRFEIQKINDISYIRALQGHTIKTIKDEELLELLKTPEEIGKIFHGSFYKFLDLIMDSGLKTMGRNHIHFAIGLPNNNKVISGMRNISEIYFTLDINKAMKNGIKFFMSKNKVILSNGIKNIISPIYFSQIFDIKKNSIIYDKNNKEDYLNLRKKFIKNYLILLDLDKKEEDINLNLILIDYFNSTKIDEFFETIKIEKDKPINLFTNMFNIINQFLLKNKLNENNDFNFVIFEKLNLIEKIIKKCINKKLEIPKYFKKFINLKEIYNKIDDSKNCDLNLIWKFLGINYNNEINNINKMFLIVIELLNKEIEFEKEFIIEIN